MPRLLFLPHILREKLTAADFQRQPEPSLVMDDPDQVAAYAHAGRVEGPMASSYLFHTAHCSKTIFGAGHAIDLGCGPATQLCQIAEANPSTQFTGIDRSPEMLAKAKAYASKRGLRNVKFIVGDMTDLSMLKSGSVDAVISTMALHHLPESSMLRTCFAEIVRVITPGGAIYLTDFTRLKRLSSVCFFVDMNAEHESDLFSLDYKNSLKAAFSFAELKKLTATLPGASIATTPPAPFLAIISTPARQPLSAALRKDFAQRRAALPIRYRADLDDMRFFLRLGGLAGDPFRE